MSQLPGKALSELQPIATLALGDLLPIVDVDEPILADKLKNVSIQQISVLLGVLTGTILKRRVVTIDSPILVTDNLVAVRDATPLTGLTLTLPNGALVTTNALLPPRITIKDELRTATPSRIITIVPFGSQTIEGGANLQITNGGGSVSLYYVPADTDWKVIYG